MGGDGGAKAEDARLDGAMDAFKRMMQAEMWLPQGGPPATGIACRSATARAFAWFDGCLRAQYRLRLRLRPWPPLLA